MIYYITYLNNHYGFAMNIYKVCNKKLIRYFVNIAGMQII